MVREMSDGEARSYILKILRERGPMTTREIEEETRKVDRKCPDGAVRYLMRLRSDGAIDGKVSLDAGGWIWSIAGHGDD